MGSVRNRVFNKHCMATRDENILSTIVENMEDMMARYGIIIEHKCSLCGSTVSFKEHGLVWSPDRDGYDREIVRCSLTCECSQGYSDLSKELFERSPWLQAFDINRLILSAPHWERTTEA